ncbi:putative membrane protein [Mycobacterium kansasii 662]|uniref:Uncharacterized protein n=3 Tax=Mycobacterium kansasii TaxID=1768 RepID=U5X1W6_MYCKA|nr:hypothetical protein MKAN_18900 [Mycobacterium kansasii ATCC 12478]EUA04856.1 putative membrane protein [Mycobacterium kansasii 824]EUA11654.1 putative membrane protein [Mycobacterium kansasii 662]KEP44043.1 hypothetical protein MKSMC1_07990 [Mycobacterium kansasii]OOK65665.1 putative membrane protein [Mycobacterium kansasii]
MSARGFQLPKLCPAGLLEHGLFVFVMVTVGAVGVIMSSS